MDTALLIEKSILVLLLFLVSLGAAAYMTYFERKLAAWIQDRVGPDRAGPFGILQPIADGVKMFLKEDFIPAKADKSSASSRPRYSQIRRLSFRGRN